MSINEIKKFRPLSLVCALSILLGLTQLVFGQTSGTQAPRIQNPTIQEQESGTQTSRIQNQNIQTIPSGAKMKFKGVVIGRDADTFTIRDRNRTDYKVLMSDRTSIKTYGGFLRSGKSYPVTDILRGLIVEVEGRGDSQGQLVADKIRFNDSDMRAAITTDTRVNPVEENQKRMSGQMDELYAVAAEARKEVAAVSERVSALDDYDVQETV